jgi:hypothetical protein
VFDHDKTILDQVITGSDFNAKRGKYRLIVLKKSDFKKYAGTGF